MNAGYLSDELQGLELDVPHGVKMRDTGDEPNMYAPGSQEESPQVGTFILRQHAYER